MGIEVTQSITVSKAVQHTLEMIMKTVTELCEADIRKKRKECQRAKIMSYQNEGDNKEGDKVWFQPRDGNAWFVLALVLYHRGQSVLLHSQGDIKKVEKI